VEHGATWVAPCEEALQGPDLLRRCPTPQVYLACPGVLLPVLPHLQLELHDSDERKRLQAVQLTIRLVTLQDSSFAQVGAWTYTGCGAPEMIHQPCHLAAPVDIACTAQHGPEAS
jgi:hypothetical protein